MQFPSGRASVIVFIGVLILAGPAPAQKKFEDEKFGYSVKPVPKWVPVPVDPTDRQTAAKWASPRAERRYPGRMLVHVFEKKSKKPSTPKDITDVRSFLTRSLESWLKWELRESKGLKPKPLKIADPEHRIQSARYYELVTDREDTARRPEDTGFYTLIAVYSTADRDYVIELYCGAINKRKYSRRFMRVLHSFRLLDAPEPKQNIQPTSAQLTPRELARQRARKDAERVPGWWYLESDNYFIVTNVPKKKKARITALRRHLEAIRKVYEADFPPHKPIEAVSIVRVCKDRNTYMNYGGSPGSAGYWYAMAKELVLYNRGEKDFVRTVLFHEAFHQYIHYACGEIRLHTWYNEGTAEYYAGAEVVGDRADIGPNRWRLDTIKGHMRAGTYVPLQKLIRYTQAEYYKSADLCYAEGWSLVYFLKKGVAPDHPWSRIHPTYYRVLVQTRGQKKALAAAFKGVDLADLDAAWKKYITRGKVARP